MRALRVKLNQILLSGNFQKYFKSISWLIGEKMISMVVAFGMSALVIRHLGAENLGGLAYALSIVGFLDVFVIMGLENTLTRNLVQEQENENIIIGSALGLRLIGFLIAITLLMGIIAFTPSTWETNLMMVILMIGSLFRGGQIFFNVFEARVMGYSDAKVKITSLVVVSLMRLALIYAFSAGVVWFAIPYVIMEMVSFIGQYLVFKKKRMGSVRSWKFDKQYARRLYRDSWPLIFSSLVTGIYMKIDQVMIKHLMDDAQTGLYFTALKFSTPFIFLPILVNSTLSPAIYAAKKESEEAYYNRLELVMSIIVMISLGISVVIALSGAWLVEVVYGAEFVESGKVVIIHVWSLVFVGLGVVSTTFLLAEGLEKMRLYRTILGAIVNVGMNFYAIPAFGIVGAAIATLLSQAVASYLTYIFSRKTRKIFWIQTKALLLISPVQRLIKELR